MSIFLYQNIIKKLTNIFIITHLINIMSESITQKDDSRNKRTHSVKRLKNMEYMDILEFYENYPSSNLKFSYLPSEISNFDNFQASLIAGEKIKVNKSGSKLKKSHFLSETDKAEGWSQVFPNQRKYSKFLQCNLYYLPEHLWEKLRPFFTKPTTENEKPVLVGYKVKDGNIHFFVHVAEVADSISWKLFYQLQEQTLDKNYIESLIGELDNHYNAESWLSIRARGMISPH